MKISEAGARALGKEEGLRLKAYKDTVGVLTIGYGHTGRMSPPKVTPGMVITERQAVEFLKNDLAPTEAAVNGKVKVPITQSMFDALVSFTFNVGVGAFGKSTLLRRLNAGDYGAAADQFLVWVKQPELKKRRDRERALFLRDGIPGAKAPSKAPKVPSGLPMEGELRIVRQGPMRTLSKEEAGAEPLPFLGGATYPDGAGIALPGGKTTVATPPASERPQVVSGGLIDTMDEDQIRQVQEMIDRAGYHEIGEIDGKWGPRSRGALSTLQLDAGLPDTSGTLDGPTLQHLPFAKRKVDTARANATSADVAATASGVIQPSLTTRARAWGGAALAGAGTILSTGLSYVGDAYEYVKDLKDSIPIGVWFGLIAAVCLYFGWRATKQVTGSVKSYQAGKVV
jgi:GH24 family phage-related lysozyme (muramidase)